MGEKREREVIQKPIAKWDSRRRQSPVNCVIQIRLDQMQSKDGSHETRRQAQQVATKAEAWYSA